MTQTQTADRSRTFSWTDPALHAAQVGRRSGLELLRAMRAGELPAPAGHAPARHGRPGGRRGRASPSSCTPQEFHYNPLGSVHGGVLATLLDTAAACSVHSTLPAGVGYTSLDLTAKFLRPVDRHLRAAALRRNGHLRAVGAPRSPRRGSPTPMTG